MTTREIAKQIVTAQKRNTEEEFGVRILCAHLNPLGFDNGWNDEREFIFIELLQQETSTARKIGMCELRRMLIEQESTRRFPNVFFIGTRMYATMPEQKEGEQV